MSEVQSIPPFLVLGMPCSRLAWLSKFLSYGPWVCGHDEIRHCRTLEDVESWFMQPFIGSAETGAAEWWRLLPKYAPECRVVTIRRAVPEVVEDLIKLGITQSDRPGLMRSLRSSEAKLNQLEKRLPRVISIQYEDLTDREFCRLVFEHCLL